MQRRRVRRSQRKQTRAQKVRIFVAGLRYEQTKYVEVGLRNALLAVSSATFGSKIAALARLARFAFGLTGVYRCQFDEFACR